MLQWLNTDTLNAAQILSYRTELKKQSPNHLVLDDLFNAQLLAKVLQELQVTSAWQLQQHTYEKLYVNSQQWADTVDAERFVQRAVWQRNTSSSASSEPLASASLITPSLADTFLTYLRSPAFLTLISDIFAVELTDMHVADPAINTNYFRLAAQDFIGIHADDSPGREVCMLLYLNADWPEDAGGELVFQGCSEEPIEILPIFNRCILFDPSSPGSEHWVKALNRKYSKLYRYNVTSWYWSE